ncbi:MAG: adenylate/guanylate cyclase domain-containing protein [Proteobacteria bacterium]|nr:adenylate/guanylate cyclase domain-containing protein [Pseudomonadota bacterium]
MNNRSTSFEVYVLQRGRWELHGRHPSTAREAAIEEAKALDKLPTITSVKVVRDVLNEHSGTSSEYTVYKSSNISESVDDEPGALPRGTRRASAPEIIDDDILDFEGFIDDDWDDEPDLKKKAKRKSRKKADSGGSMSVGRGILKLLTIVGGSALLSAIITFIVALAFSELPELRRAIGLVQSDYNNVLFAVFIISLLFTVGTSAYAFISSSDLKVAKRDPKDRRSHAEQFEAQELSEWKNVLGGGASKRRMAKRAAKRAREYAENNPDSREKPDLLDRNWLDAEITTDSEQKPSEKAKEETSPPVTLSSDAEKLKVILMTFLSKGLESVMKTRPKLDNFNKFGVNLFLAGACEAVGAAGKLNDKERAQILRESVEVLGTSGERADKFAKAYDSYLLDPKYLSMIEAGRDAMQRHLGGSPGAPAMLDHALNDWNQRKPDEDESGIRTIAVMFTDIVGSTDMTQTHGDAAAQEVVRTHNRIVRAALAEYNGKEVKHTGDGIMASFADTPNAALAAIYIQEMVAADNATNPTVPLGIKIGINSGEPIVEDDDLFGTTVQLSARIVDKAGLGQIFVSEGVRAICNDGHGLTFINRGAREMKGFKDPIVLYEVQWSGTKATPPAPAPAPPPTPQPGLQSAGPGA